MSIVLILLIESFDFLEDLQIIMIVFKCINGMAPEDLRGCLQYSKHSNKVLIVPRNQTKFGDRSFSSCGPILWNALPLDIRNIERIDTFKGQLKHYLFSNHSVYNRKVHDMV